MKKNLTAKYVETAKPSGAERDEIADAGCPGLYLRVGRSGTRSWSVRFRIAGRGEGGMRGKPVNMPLGQYPLLSLEKARAAARAALEPADRGDDPRAQRQAELREKAARNFETVAEKYVDLYAKPNLTKWRDCERLLIERVVPVWRGRDIATLTRADAHDLLDDLSQQKGPAFAREVRKHLSGLFSWAADRGMIPASPVALMRRPDLAGVSRDRVLSMDELREVWATATVAGYPFGDFTRLLILTAQRRTEIGELRGEWLRPDQTAFEIPSSAGKTGNPQVVPLSAPAQAILDSLPRWNGGDFLFSTTNGVRPISGYAQGKNRLDRLIAEARRKAGIADDIEAWTYHDLRRSAATHMARLSIPQEIIERVLGHVIPGVAGTYNRYSYLEEKRAALETWGALWA